MKRIFRWLLSMITVLLVIIFSLIGRIDRTPLEDQPFYQEMHARLDTLTLNHSASLPIRVAWAKVNITPSYSMPMAGYTPRDHFDTVHDSLYARLLAIDNGRSMVLFLNVDLLLFPPELKERIDQYIHQSGKNIFLYPAATHTHNGVGGWDHSLLGRFALGSYHAEWLDEITKSISTAIDNLQPVPAILGYFENEIPGLVENRLVPDGLVDEKLRGLIIERSDSLKALLFTFSAHPTSISKESSTLTADYPAAIINATKDRFDFGMFMAGMVGSHRFRYFEERDFELTEKLAHEITPFIPDDPIEWNDSISFLMAHVPIVFGSSQARLSDNWKIRDWAFRALGHPLQGEITLMGLGNIILMGTPCDFSGEIYARDELGVMAQQQGKNLMITSFNGNYNGYITLDVHYEEARKEEVMSMNWVGPYYGQYFSWMIRHLTSSAAKN